MPIPGDEIEHFRNSSNARVKVDGKNMISDIVSRFGDFLFSADRFIFRQTLCLVNLSLS